MAGFSGCIGPVYRTPITMYGFIVSLLLYFLLARPVSAAYVLPYPSFMPGNKMYTIMRIIDRLKAYWYFGDIGQFTYHLSLSDKYLVEAKTLFEYQQYLLGVDALRRSSLEFDRLPGYLRNARTHGKDIRDFQNTISEAAFVHADVLTKLNDEVPMTFTWSPEKQASTVLPLRDMLSAATTDTNQIATEAAQL